MFGVATIKEYREFSYLADWGWLWQGWLTDGFVFDAGMALGMMFHVMRLSFHGLLRNHLFWRGTLCRRGSIHAIHWYKCNCLGRFQPQPEEDWVVWRGGVVFWKPMVNLDLLKMICAFPDGNSTTYGTYREYSSVLEYSWRPTSWNDLRLVFTWPVLYRLVWKWGILICCNVSFESRIYGKYMYLVCYIVVIEVSLGSVLSLTFNISHIGFVCK